MRADLKLVSLANVLDGTGVLVYEVPETIKRAKVKFVSATLVSTAAGNLNAALLISSSQGDIKAILPVENVGAGHAAISFVTWGVTGAYYRSLSVGGDDLHAVPMVSVDISGGDQLQFQALVGAGEGWSNVSIWLDISDH